MLFRSTLALMGGGNVGEEVKRKIMGGRKVHKTLQDLHVPDRLKWVPEEVRGLGPGYDMGQMWVKFAEAIRTSTNQRGHAPHYLIRKSIRAWPLWAVPL